MQYKIGQLVRVKDGLNEGRVAKIIKQNAIGWCDIEFNNGNRDCYHRNDLEPVSKSFDHPFVGDVYENKDGKRMVLGASGRGILLSCLNDYNSSSCGFWTKEELIEDNYKIIDTETEETVEVLGKKYNKSKVEERLKELEEEK